MTGRLNEIQAFYAENPLNIVKHTEQQLDAIAQRNPSLNAFTSISRRRAIEAAERLTEKQNLAEMPLAGATFAVKNLFDIAGEVTLAGSKLNECHSPASQDATLIERLENAGAILTGALNMGEYAYDFTGENCHHGNCSNPYKLDHMAGGSSSGSAAAVAAGLVDFSLGSDTNGSIRVPASFCGIFGLKPTYGRLPRTGTFPFSDSLDHLGPLARSTHDLARVYDVLQGYDGADHACVDRHISHTATQLNLGIQHLRFARLEGYFNCAHFPQANKAMDKVCKALDVQQEIVPEGVTEGRSAAYLITNVEGSSLHLSRLQQSAAEFDPDTRDRFLAGAMLPAAWYIRAQQVRRWYQEKMLALFKNVEVLIAPATPCVAPRQGQKTLKIAGEEQLLRPNLGYFTQPFSAIGLPSIVVPTQDEETGMPIGVQIIAAPWREDICLRVAAYLEDAGFCFVPPPLYSSAA